MPEPEIKSGTVLVEEPPSQPVPSKAVLVAQALVRPYVTVLFSTTVAAGWLNGRLSDDAFLGLAGMAIGFWFIQRQAAKGSI